MNIHPRFTFFGLTVPNDWESIAEVVTAWRLA